MYEDHYDQCIGTGAGTLVGRMTLHRDLLQELEKNLVILEELGNLSRLPNLPLHSGVEVL
jgi:hypothetical protein